MRLKGISNSKLNMSIDIVMLLQMLLMAGIGFIMKYVTLSGEERNVRYGNHTDLEFLGLTRHEWGSIHLIISITFLVLLVLHILFHWDVILGILKRMFPLPYLRNGILILLGLLTVFTLLTPFLVEPEQVPFVPKYRNRINDISTSELTQPLIPDNQIPAVEHRVGHGKNAMPPADRTESVVHESQHNPEYDQYEVFGYHTIQMLADKYNVPAEVITKDLNLPSEVAGEKLGWLRKRYSFTMNDVRRSIYDYKKRNN